MRSVPDTGTGCSPAAYWVSHSGRSPWCPDPQTSASPATVASSGSCPSLEVWLSKLDQGVSCSALIGRLQLCPRHSSCTQAVQRLTVKPQKCLQEPRRPIRLEPQDPGPSLNPAAGPARRLGNRTTMLWPAVRRAIRKPACHGRGPLHSHQAGTAARGSPCRAGVML